MVENHDNTKDTGPDTKDKTKVLSVRLDPVQLKMFLHEYYNQNLPQGSVSSLISHAFSALIGAKVIVNDDGTPITDTDVSMNGGRIWADVNRHNGSGGENLVWANADTIFDPVITSLIDLLVEVLNSPPFEGLIGHPHTRN